MKILFISPEGNLAPLAQKVSAEGHDVKIYPIPNNNILQGFKVRFIDSWESGVRWANLVVCDDVIFPHMDILHKSGKLIVGGNKLFDKMENDRLFGKKVFKRLGLDIRDCARFSSFDKGIEFIKANPDRWVFKADGQADRTLGYVGKESDGSDVIKRLEFYKEHANGKMKKLWDKKVGTEFVLERAADGLEVAVGAYFDGNSFSCVNLNFEHKKRSCGDIGVSTGEMGTGVYLLETNAAIFHRTLKKLKPLLQKSPYHTYVDLNCIVTKDKAYVLEVTSRFGWPIEAALDQLRTISIGEFYLRLASGKLTSSCFMDKTAVVYTVGSIGFPYKEAFEALGSDQPFSFPAKNLDNIYLSDATFKDGQLMTTDKGEGYTLVVATTGKDIKEAKEKGLNICESIELPGKDYRIDIGDKIEKNLKQLTEWKWI